MPIKAFFFHTTPMRLIDSEGRNYFEEKKVEYNIKKDEQVAKISAQVGFIK